MLRQRGASGPSDGAPGLRALSWRGVQVLGATTVPLRKRTSESSRACAAKLGESPSGRSSRVGEGRRGQISCPRVLAPARMPLDGAFHIAQCCACAGHDAASGIPRADRCSGGLAPRRLPVICGRSWAHRLRLGSCQSSAAADGLARDAGRLRHGSPSPHMLCRVSWPLARRRMRRSERVVRARWRGAAGRRA